MFHRLTAVEMKSVELKSCDVLLLHRHAGEHLADPTCWCCPMVMTAEQLTHHSVPELDAVLDHFYALH